MGVFKQQPNETIQRHPLFHRRLCPSRYLLLHDRQAFIHLKPKTKNQTMEKLILKINRVVQDTREVPEYFRIGTSQYFRIVSDKSYVSVNHYDVTKAEMEGLILLPEIRVNLISHLYIYIQDKEIVEITKEDFTKVFDSCMNFMDRL